MHGRGVTTASTAGLARWWVAVLSLSLILAWPGSGAGPRGGDHRRAMSLAVHVDASATLIVGAAMEGRHWPGEDFVGRPRS